MITFSGSFYLVKGRVKELLTATAMGIEQDHLLESFEKQIVPALEALVKKDKELKKAKNCVYFVEFEDAKWLESGRFKQDFPFTITSKQDYSPKNFIKFNKMMLSYEKGKTSQAFKYWGLIGMDHLTSTDEVVEAEE
jgi:hypothetical protein